ncbi:MAG: ABC transporter ATP-binding protein [Bacilli bacterium]|nr:ABC transporter ATP-binding protein [Bacilli bacterium]
MSANDMDKLKGYRTMKTGEIFKRTFKYMKNEVGKFIISFFLLLVGVAAEISFSVVFGKITSYVKSESAVLSTIIFAAIGYMALILVSNFFSYLQAMILQKAGQKVIYNLRMEVFEHIENMSQNQFDEMPVGSLVTRVTDYTSAMSDLFTNTIVNVLKNILMVVTVFTIMMFYSVKLTLIVTLVLSLVFVISYFFRFKARKIFSDERQLISDANTFLNESLSGMKITQIFNQEERKKNEFEVKNDAIRKNKDKIMVAFALYRPTVSFLYHVSVGLVILYSFEFGFDGGQLTTFYLLLSRLFNPIQNIADQINAIQRARTSSERLFNLIDVKPEVLDEPDAIDVDHFEGKIEFKNVWFAYEKEEWILKDVSFTIEPKTTAAFVGATGAGKTTILGLIVRNYEIQKGEILIDGINIKHIKIKSLRKAIGQMLQDVFLFTGNIRDNITLHDSDIPEEEINEACEYVNANSFIKKNELGLDAPVIERGENFSQGQRQLLSFARTVLAKPQILILDEATANIDTETEVLIQESLEKMKSIGTMLVVAHRLSTIQKADQIIVLSHGVIIERGTHQELLKNRGHYFKLYQLQFKE